MSDGVTGTTAAETGQGARREAILAAAARLISRHGVRGLRVEEVAAEAGVSAPLLYYHFTSRQGLIRAALGRAGDRAPSSALRDKSGAGDGYGAVRDALLAELSEDQPVRDNAVVWGEVSASAVFEPELRAEVARVTAEWKAVVATAIARGIEDGSIRADIDPEQVAELLTTLVDGLCNRWLGQTLTLERARELLAFAIERSLRAPA